VLQLRCDTAEGELTSTAFKVAVELAPADAAAIAGELLRSVSDSIRNCVHAK
jgi:hypothetical protein